LFTNLSFVRFCIKASINYLLTIQVKLASVTLSAINAKTAQHTVAKFCMQTRVVTVEEMGWVWCW